MMKRRSLLAALGLVPAAAMFPKIAAAAALAPESGATSEVSAAGLPPTIIDGGSIISHTITAEHISCSTIAAGSIKASKITIRDLDDNLRVRMGLLDDGKYGLELRDRQGQQIV